MKAANFQLTPVGHNSLIQLWERPLAVCPLGHGCCGCVDRQPGEGAGKAGKRGNSPKSDFLLAQTLLTTRLGRVPRGGTLRLHAGVCRDWGRHIGREESGQLWAQLEGELRGDAELLSLLAFLSLSPRSRPVLWSCGPGPAQLPCCFPAMLLVPAWRDPQQRRGA